MLYRINKAWATIIVNQVKNGIIDDALLVTSGDSEYYYVRKLLEQLDSSNCWLIDEQNVRDVISNKLNDKCFGDVLVSHEMTDMILKDYLTKHCKRLERR